MLLRLSSHRAGHVTGMGGREDRTVGVGRGGAVPLRPFCTCWLKALRPRPPLSLEREDGSTLSWRDWVRSRLRVSFSHLLPT